MGDPGTPPSTAGAVGEQPEHATPTTSQLLSQAGQVTETRLTSLEAKFSDVQQSLSDLITANNSKVDLVIDELKASNEKLAVRLDANDEAQQRLAQAIGTLSDTMKLLTIQTGKKPELPAPPASFVSSSSMLPTLPYSPIPMSTPYTPATHAPRTQMDVDKDIILDNKIAEMGDQYCSKIINMIVNTNLTVLTQREALRYHFFAIVDGPGPYGGFVSPDDWKRYTMATGVRSKPIAEYTPSKLYIAEYPFVLLTPLPHSPTIPAIRPDQIGLRTYSQDSSVPRRLKFSSPLMPGQATYSAPPYTPGVPAYSYGSMAGTSTVVITEVEPEQPNTTDNAGTSAHASTTLPGESHKGTPGGSNAPPNPPGGGGGGPPLDEG